MALGAGKWRWRRRKADFKDTGNTQFRSVKGIVQMWLSSPSPHRELQKGSEVTRSPGPPLQSKKSTAIFHRLKYLFNNKKKKRPQNYCKTIFSVIIVIYNTKQLISSEI